MTGAFVGAAMLVVPALGLAKSPTRQPLRDEAREFGLPVLYGPVNEVMRRALRQVVGDRRSHRMNAATCAALVSPLPR